jgi:L-threonylcarbamoyladenylate synthase
MSTGMTAETSPSQLNSEPGATRAQVLLIRTPLEQSMAVDAAVKELRNGGVVALPTETVYGLAANALDPAAVERIFAVKGRSSANPLIVHVASLEMARTCVMTWTHQADQLASAFWPGPLTMVLPSAATIPAQVRAGGTTVGIRWSSHPIMQAVIAAAGFPLAAPSANTSLRLSPTTASHVLDDLGGRIPLILDGGPSQVGIESTVIDMASASLRILRPGMIHAESLAAVLQMRVELQNSVNLTGPFRSPGQLAKHYSPRARLVVRAWSSEADLVRQLQHEGLVSVQCQVLAHRCIPGSSHFAGVAVLPHDPAVFARSLYAELHRCDAESPACIVVEAVPETPGWLGIRDRLHRASA